MHIYSRVKANVVSFLDIQPTPRLMLFFIAVVFKLAASALGAIGFVWNSPIMMISGTVIWIIWFLALFFIAMPQTNRLIIEQMRWLKPAALTIAAILITLGIVLLIIVSCFGLGVLQVDKLGEKPEQLADSFENVFAYNDATALCHQATVNLIDGKNPYAEANVVSAMQFYNGSFDKITPLREGIFADAFPYPDMEELEQFWIEALQTPQTVPSELETLLGYPAGCFLLPAPFVLMGIEDIRIIYLILLIPALGYVLLKAPKKMRIIFIVAFLASLEIWNSIAAGETGSLYFPFLLLAWVLPKRHLWLSALFMGVAIATKQVAWFFMPFYLILILRTTGMKKMLAVLAIAVTVFFAANVPFIISDPKLWISSIMSPMLDNMFPLGVGIVSLVSGGVLDIHSPFVFSLLEVLVGVVVVVWYYRNCRRYPHSGLVLAMLPLFFAWRSLWPYFYYADIIILAAIITDEYAVSLRQPEPLAVNSHG
ncbi:hypothetical protein ACFLYB_06360 [Chloroflexota bacterium]